MEINKEKNFLSAVIYVNNNEDKIADFLRQLNDIFSENFEKYEIICVNDDSCDGSVKIIKNMAGQMKNCVLSVINMSYFQGIEASMNAGVDLAIGDFVFEFDNIDMDYDINLVMEIYRHSLKGYDIVSASNSNSTFFSKIFYKLYNKSADIKYKLNTETFRIISRRAINRIHSMSKTIPYRKALYANCGLSIDTIFYKSNNRQKKKKSKKMVRYRQDTALNALILFTDIAYRTVMYITILMMLLTISVIIYTITVYVNGKPVPGFTTIMLVMTGSFFAVFAILLVIIKYLSLLVELVFMKQKYTIQSIEKITK